MKDFKDLIELNVNERVEDKNGLKYLSWSWAWQEVIKRYPEATYEILRFENNLPYVYDDNTGYMVFTKVSINGITREMWLPVMDNANKAMLSQPYTYKVKDYKTQQYVEKWVQPATMFDINKTIMRCLTKNLAMFGLGLYIYSGEDLPETIDDNLNEVEKDTTDYKKELETFLQENKLNKVEICKKYNLTGNSKQEEFKTALLNLKLEVSNAS